MMNELANHLWQSTAFVAVAALVAFALRNNGAHVRHGVWLIASLKFLVPFSFLMSLGGTLPSWTLAGPTMAETSAAVTSVRDLSVSVERFAQPFAAEDAGAVLPIAATQGPMLVAGVLLGIWAVGFIAVVAMRLRGWQRVRAAVRASVPLLLSGAHQVRSAPGLLEPGVVGIFHPVLLLPEGIDQHLSQAQLRAVLEHEFTHIRRRDNLTSALHMVVEAVFWFNPVVWWVGARLVAERERACDEQVLRVCGEPQVYAESILNVCKLYVESPIACVSGVSGSDLKRRVTAIMAGRIGARLSRAGQLGMAVVAMLVVSAPLLAGMAGSAAQAGSPARFEAVTVKPCDTSDPKPVIGAARSGFRNAGAPYAGMVTPGHVFWSCATLAQLIPQAYTSTEQPLLNTASGLRIEEDFQPRYVKGGPSWVTTERFTIEAKASLEMTNPVLGTSPARSVLAHSAAMSVALRAVLEDRFQLKVTRATEQRDMYALTIVPAGLNKQRVAAPVAGDCLTTDQYSAQAATRTVEQRMAAGNPRLCGRAFSSQSGWEYTSATFAQLARDLSGRLDYVVLDRTATESLFNFNLTIDSSSGGSRDADYARALAALGLKLDLVKGPAEHLAIQSAQRMKDPAGTR